MKDYFASAAMQVMSFVLLVFFAFSGPVAAAELRLAMFEQTGCHWCKRWHAEVGPAYPKTTEGQAAPLMRLQFRDDVPDDVHLTRPPRFTPTFVLLSDGTEVGRIEGYPGEDFFWPMLAELIARAAAAPVN